MLENQKVIGKVQLILKDQFDNIKYETIVDNAVVLSGKVFIASRMAGTSSPVMSHMAIGTNTTSVSDANTQLGTEAFRKALLSTTPTSFQVVYSAFFDAGEGTGTITEAGIFDASSAGTMLCRTVFTGIPKDVNDTLTVNWTVSIV